jgi:hypothetical protein
MMPAVEVVTADGKRSCVASGALRNLFHALPGGGPNFAVVTAAAKQAVTPSRDRSSDRRGALAGSPPAARGPGPLREIVRRWGIEFRTSHIDNPTPR